MRVPLIFAHGTAQDVYLAEAGFAVPEAAYVERFNLAAAGHIAGCACCSPRGAVALALTALFRARATGAAPPFTRVVVAASAAGKAAVHEAMQDVLVAARYRLPA